MRTKASDGQSLVDMALMTTGATEGVWALALRNGMSVTERLAEGAGIAWEPEDVEDTRTVSRYGLEGIRPATEVDATTMEMLLGLEKTAADKVWSWDTVEAVADPVVAQTTRAMVHGPEFESVFA